MIFDEFHERSLQADLGFGLREGTQRLFRKTCANARDVGHPTVLPSPASRPMRQPSPAKADSSRDHLNIWTGP